MLSYSWVELFIIYSLNFSILGTLNPNVLLELFSMYREWQEEKAKKISRKQVLSCIMLLLHDYIGFRMFILTITLFNILLLLLDTSGVGLDAATIYLIFYMCIC